MTDAEIAKLQQERESLLAENAELEADLPEPTPEEWKRQAKAFEAEVDDYPNERIDTWCDAAHAWAQANELDEAERCHREAASVTPEEGFPDPRVFYAMFLFDHRDPARGYELLDELWRSRPTGPATYYLVSEPLEERGDYQQALNWANAGLSRCYPQPFEPDADEVMQDPDLDMLLSARFRVRQAMEQPMDSLDTLNQQARVQYGKAFEAMARESKSSSRSTALYWPEDEFAERARRWPESASSDHTEHRREVERALRGSSEGNTPVVVWGQVAGFVEFCEDRERSASSGSSRDEYAAHLVEFGNGLSWPPGRNDPCWCGSRRKYKKCCGTTGFAEPVAGSGAAG